MKHAVKKRKLGRVKKQREALVRSLAIALIEEDRIITTLAKAKELRPFIEPLVTRARKGTLSDHRMLVSLLNNNTEVVSKLVNEIAKKYEDRPGGYTRILKLPRRSGDASPMALIEWV